MMKYIVVHENDRVCEEECRRHIPGGFKSPTDAIKAIEWWGFRPTHHYRLVLCVV